jgi:hypothetical protein
MVARLQEKQCLLQFRCHSQTFWGRWSTLERTITRNIKKKIRRQVKRNNQDILPRILRSYRLIHRGFWITTARTLPNNVFVGQKAWERITDMLSGWWDWKIPNH